MKMQRVRLSQAILALVNLGVLKGLQQDIERVSVTMSHVLGCEAWGGCPKKLVRPSMSFSSSRTKGLGEIEGERLIHVIFSSEGPCAGSPFDPEGPARRIKSMQAKSSP